MLKSEAGAKSLAGDSGLLTAREIATPVRVLLYSVRQAPSWSAVLVLTTLTSCAVTLLLPAELARAVDAAIARAPTASVLAKVAALSATAVLSDVLARWAGAAGTTSVEVALRQGLTRRLLLAGIPGQRRFPVGDLTSRMVSAAADAAGLVSTVLWILESVLLSAGGLLALALIDWSLAVVFVVCIPVALVLMRRFIVRASELTERYQELQGRLSALLVEALAGSRTIAASGAIAREVDRVLAPLPELAMVGRLRWDEQRESAWKMSLLVPLTELVVLAVAGLGVSGGRVTEGEWVAVAGYVATALGFFSVTEMLLGLARIQAGAKRLAKVLELPVGVRGSKAIPALAGQIVLRSVRVTAAEDVLLDGLDLEIPRGKLIAIVGRSGAGKSTLAAVAGGLLAPDDGQVLLDGIPLSELRPDGLRGLVAYSFERPALLGETVHDTIAYGSADASRERVALAAASVSADGFIRRLPQGYDTKLAAAPFSGGEMQRLGLARAMAGDPRVLILDDATSSLDTVTEAEVARTLTLVLAGRTRIVVAHRAGTAARADLVVWLEGGRVRAVSPHRQLWRVPEYQSIFGVAEERAARSDHLESLAETRIDSSTWLYDIRREFPSVGVLQLSQHEWTALWGRSHLLRAASPAELYGQLRDQLVPSGEKDQPKWPS